MSYVNLKLTDTMILVLSKADKQQHMNWRIALHQTLNCWMGVGWDNFEDGSIYFSGLMKSLVFGL